MNVHIIRGNSSAYLPSFTKYWAKYVIFPIICSLNLTSVLLDHEVHLPRSFIFIFHILILSPYQSLAYPTPIALRTKAECHWSIFRAIQSFILKNKTIKTLSHASLLIFRNKHFDSQWQSSSYCKKRQKSGKLMPISSLPH